MNEVGSLAKDIVVYHFDHNDADHPISFVSGWMEANIGQLNGWTNEEFSITGTGAFSPSLEPVEKAIFTCLYEMDYYRKESRKALRGITTDNVDWSSLKEGDSSIQKTTKHQVSRSFQSLEAETREKLKDIVSRYNIYKASPVQVAGTDYVPFFLDRDYSTNNYNLY